MHRVQRRRLGMAAAAVPIFLLYAALARLPLDMKVFLFVFAAISGMYALSLDWAAWGREQLRLVGLAKAIVPGCVLLCLLIAIRSQHLLAWLIVGNFVGYSLQAIVFWVWWKRHQQEIGEQEQGVAAIGEALQWGRTSIMGLAWLGNLRLRHHRHADAGHHVESRAARALQRRLSHPQPGAGDLLFANKRAVSTTGEANRGRTVANVEAAHFPWHCLSSGSAVSVLVAIFRRPLLTILFGHDFLVAAPLLLVLACAIPLDFLVTYLNSAYIAWSMERKVLVCTVVAAVSNIVLNWIGIPRYGAMAAAVNTVISYVVYLAGLAIAGKVAKELLRAKVDSVAV